MKVTVALHPLMLFVLPSVLSIIAWAITPHDWFMQVGITQKADWSSVAVPWLIGFAAFAFGSSLRHRTFHPARSAVIPSSDANRQALWLTLVLISMSMIALAYLIIRDAGVHGLVQGYVVRASYIQGVTTFSLLTSAALALSAALYFTTGRMRTVCVLPLLGALAFAAYRAVYGFERLALFIPFVAAGVAYLLSRKQHITRRGVVPIIVGGLGVVVTLFVGLEYLRTFGTKMAYGENINENPVLYGLQRLVLYFATSVNSGATEYQFYTDGLVRHPLFVMTFSPAASILYSMLEIAPIGQSSTLVNGADVAISMGLYNPEFNNRWGVATPLTEGWIPGLLFWLIWGFYGTHLYLKVKRQRLEPWNVALFGLFVAAFIDNQSRVGLLAAPHFLLPLLWLEALRIGSRIVGQSAVVDTRLPRKHARFGARRVMSSSGALKDPIQ